MMSPRNHGQLFLRNNTRNQLSTAQSKIANRSIEASIHNNPGLLPPTTRMVPLSAISREMVLNKCPTQRMTSGIPSIPMYSSVVKSEVKQEADGTNKTVVTPLTEKALREHTLAEARKAARIPLIQPSKRAIEKVTYNSAWFNHIYSKFNRNMVDEHDTREILTFMKDFTYLICGDGKLDASDKLRDVFGDVLKLLERFSDRLLLADLSKKSDEKDRITRTRNFVTMIYEALTKLAYGTYSLSQIRALPSDDGSGTDDDQVKVKIDDKEMTLADLRTQVTAIYDKMEQDEKGLKSVTEHTSMEQEDEAGLNEDEHGNDDQMDENVAITVRDEVDVETSPVAEEEIVQEIVVIRPISQSYDLLENQDQIITNEDADYEDDVSVACELGFVRELPTVDDDVDDDNLRTEDKCDTEQSGDQISPDADQTQTSYDASATQQSDAPLPNNVSSADSEIQRSDPSIITAIKEVTHPTLMQNHALQSNVLQSFNFDTHIESMNKSLPLVNDLVALSEVCSFRPGIILSDEQIRMCFDEFASHYIRINDSELSTPELLASTIYDVYAHAAPFYAIVGDVLVCHPNPATLVVTNAYGEGHSPILPPINISAPVIDQRSCSTKVSSDGLNVTNDMSGCYILQHGCAVPRPPAVSHSIMIPVLRSSLFVHSPLKHDPKHGNEWKYAVMPMTKRHPTIDISSMIEKDKVSLLSLSSYFNCLLDYSYLLKPKFNYVPIDNDQYFSEITLHQRINISLLTGMNIIILNPFNNSYTFTRTSSNSKTLTFLITYQRGNAAELTNSLSLYKMPQSILHRLLPGEILQTGSHTNIYASMVDEIWIDSVYDMKSRIVHSASVASPGMTVERSHVSDTMFTLQQVTATSQLSDDEISSKNKDRGVIYSDQLSKVLPGGKRSIESKCQYYLNGRLVEYVNKCGLSSVLPFNHCTAIEVANIKVTGDTSQLYSQITTVAITSELGEKLLLFDFIDKDVVAANASLRLYAIHLDSKPILFASSGLVNLSESALQAAVDKLVSITPRGKEHLDGSYTYPTNSRCFNLSMSFNWNETELFSTKSRRHASIFMTIQSEAGEKDFNDSTLSYYYSCKHVDSYKYLDSKSFIQMPCNHVIPSHSFSAHRHGCLIQDRAITFYNQMGYKSNVFNHAHVCYKCQKTYPLRSDAKYCCSE